MPTYKVTDPATGRTLKLTGDSPPTEAELNEIFGAAPTQAQQAPKTGMVEKAWNALAVPEQKAREGLQMIAGAVPGAEPTGNVLRDVALNTPKVLAESVAEVAPSFVSRGTILTAGALQGAKVAKPLIKAAGRGLAKSAEALSGLEHNTPGVLLEAAKDASLRSASTADATPLYEAGKKIGGKVSSTLTRIPEKLKVVKRAIQLADEGKLNPTEALEARKELSAIKNNVSGEFFRKTTERLNEIAKPVFGKADEVFARGVKGEALRSPLPLNKSGGSSTFKTILGGAQSALTLGVMSPYVQGQAATKIGQAARAAAPFVNNAIKTTIGKVLTEEAARQYLKWARGNREKARGMATADGWVIPD